MTQRELLTKAEQCKRLALGLGDDQTRVALERLAREYEAEALRRSLILSRAIC